MRCGGAALVVPSLAHVAIVVAVATVAPDEARDARPADEPPGESRLDNRGMPFMEGGFIR